ncbi:RYamide receptor-like [Stylophora pistillata]|uniref:RYamide receptor-like n=1 Tax=Stylophora pistillata TaxID=50429 RepID=UPI000C0565B3|nr:RYamide receptor-like [Stylophora pistillata]
MTVDPANETLPANCINYGRFTPRNLGMTFAYGLLLVTSLSGNFLIVIVVYKMKTMRTTINFFIVNMAMSDLLFPVFVFPLLLTEMYVGGFGPPGKNICLVLFLLQYVSSWVSIQSLILIAVDRFLAVVFPLHSPIITSKVRPFVILTTWIVATASSFPMLVFYNSMEFSEKLNCGRIWFTKYFREKYYIHVMPLNVVFKTIPFILLATLYSVILFKLKIQTIPGERSINAEEQRVQRNRKVLKMATAILLGFAMCWMPLSIIGFLGLSLGDSEGCGRIPPFVIVAVFLNYANCAVNPCICFTFCRNFRQALKGLLYQNAPGP